MKEQIYGFLSGFVVVVVLDVCCHVRIKYYCELLGRLHFLVQLIEFGMLKGKKRLCAAVTTCGKGHFISKSTRGVCAYACILYRC